jgi:hypothetical protein
MTVLKRATGLFDPRANLTRGRTSIDMAEPNEIAPQHGHFESGSGIAA